MTIWEKFLIIEKFAAFSDAKAIFEQVKNTWVLAYDATHEERHKGVSLICYTLRSLP